MAGPVVARHEIEFGLITLAGSSPPIGGWLRQDVARRVGW